MRPETKLKDIYADVLKKHGRVTRVENLCESGTPDFNICIQGVEAWIEFKAPPQPVRSSSKVFSRASHKFTPEQVNWIDKQVKCGGIGLAIIHCGRWMFTVDGIHIFLLNDVTIDQLFDYSLHRVELAPRQAAEALPDILRRLDLSKRG